MSDLRIHVYEKPEKSFIYEPPEEIKTIIGTGIRSRIYQMFGPLPLTQKILGYIANNTHLLTDDLLKKATEEMLQELKKFDFDSTNEVFNFEYERKQYGDSSCVLAPSDGLFSHNNIEHCSDLYISNYLNKIDIDLGKMLGVQDVIKTSINSYNLLGSRSIVSKMKSFIYSLEGGIHDLTILKPEDKHIISVPIESRVKLIYRLDRHGALYPVDINKVEIGRGITYSTDPSYAQSNPEKKILDGNPRMIFLLTALIDGKKIDYAMVAHSASLIRGVEALKKQGERILPGEYLFKYHFGSSVSTLFPKIFLDSMTLVPGIKGKSKGNNLLKIEEGQVLYVPKNKSNEKPIQINKNQYVQSEDLFSE